MKSTDDLMPRVWLVRHGESTWNVLGLIQGQAKGPELTGRGREQAAQVADTFRHIRVQAVYASDLKRDTDTAELIAAATLPIPTSTRNFGVQNIKMLRRNVERNANTRICRNIPIFSSVFMIATVFPPPPA